MKHHHHSGLFAVALCLSAAAAGTGLAYGVTDLLMRYALARERPKPMGFVSRLLSDSMGRDSRPRAVSRAPGERTFYRVKVPNAPGSGKR